MRQPTQKEIALLALLGGLGIVVYMQWSKLMPAAESPEEAARAAVQQVELGRLPAIVPVLLDQTQKVAIRKNSRNLFNYSKSPDEIADEIRQRKEAERLAKEAEERRRIQQAAEAAAAAQRAQALALNPPPPEAPPIPFRFIGKMGDSKSPIAVLADTGPGGEVYTAREGEVIAEKFRIQRIEFDSVTIGYAESLIAQHPEWATQTKVVKMGS